MKNVSTEEKLFNKIMGYWETCAFRDNQSDWDINILVEEYAVKCGIDMAKIQGRVDYVVRNLTNSQKRELYKLMINSGIRERV